MTTHPDKRGITMVRVVVVDFALVFSATNPISIPKGHLLVRVKCVRERVPEAVLTFTSIQVVSGE